MARFGRSQPPPPHLARFAVPTTSDVTIALTGVAATAAVGTLGVLLTLGLTGNAGTGAVGTVSPATSVSVSGNAGTGSVGSVTPSNTHVTPHKGNRELFWDIRGNWQTLCARCHGRKTKSEQLSNR